MITSKINLNHDIFLNHNREREVLVIDDKRLSRNELQSLKKRKVKDKNIITYTFK